MYFSFRHGVHPQIDLFATYSGRKPLLVPLSIGMDAIAVCMCSHKRPVLLRAYEGRLFRIIACQVSQRAEIPATLKVGTQSI